MYNYIRSTGRARLGTRMYQTLAWARALLMVTLLSEDVYICFMERGGHFELCYCSGRGPIEGVRKRVQGFVKVVDS
jgi:hypothetical protein